jgi:hypothetical protein
MDGFYEKNLIILRRNNKLASKKQKKIPTEIIKQLPQKTLQRCLKNLREYLKKNETVQRMFEEYDVPLSELDLIPMAFADLDVSAKTDHGIIYYNYSLLSDGDFFKDFMYGTHEITHWLQQTTGDGPTQGADDGEYLDNKFEQEGFQNQLEYMADEFGIDEAEKYVDDLLDHHEVESKKEKKEKKEVLLSKI